MNRLIQFVSLAMAAIMSVFSPIQTTHGTNSCCAECQFKKEDEIEVVDEHVQEDTSN